MVDLGCIRYRRSTTTHEVVSTKSKQPKPAFVAGFFYALTQLGKTFGYLKVSRSTEQGLLSLLLRALHHVRRKHLRATPRSQLRPRNRSGRPTRRELLRDRFHRAPRRCERDCGYARSSHVARNEA